MRQQWSGTVDEQIAGYEDDGYIVTVRLGSSVTMAKGPNIDLSVFVAIWPAPDGGTYTEEY